MSVVEQPASPADDDPRPEVEKRKREIRRRLERLIGIAATEGNELRVLRNGDEIFPAMLEAIRAAEYTVDMMTFVYWRGEIAREFAAALSERARHGVRVRLLLDGFAGRSWRRRPRRPAPMHFSRAVPQPGGRPSRELRHRRAVPLFSGSPAGREGQRDNAAPTQPRPTAPAPHEAVGR